MLAAEAGLTEGVVDLRALAASAGAFPLRDAIAAFERVMGEVPSEPPEAEGDEDSGLFPATHSPQDTPPL